MKRLKTTILLVFTIFTFAQAQETDNLLTAPENWTSERLHFPLSFAPTLDLKGFEDLQFSPEWREVGSDGFWTYTFVWNCEKKFEMNIENLSKSMNAYFDGLMRLSNPAKEGKNGPALTKSQFVQTEDGFEGYINTYDNFFTKKGLKLNVKIEELSCPKEQRQYILFRLSPQTFEHKVWKTFDLVRLDVTCE